MLEDLLYSQTNYILVDDLHLEAAVYLNNLTHLMLDTRITVKHSL